MLGLGVVEGSVGGWGVLMAALLAGTAFGGFFDLIALFGRPPWGRGALKELLEHVCTWSGILFFSLSIAAILFRKRFCRMNDRLQWMMALAAIIAFALLTAAFAYSMR